MVFQAGRLGHKPWDNEASFGVLVNFANAVFTKLVYVDAKYNLRPGIIKKWQWDFKTKSFVFEIRDDLYFDSKRKLERKYVEFALVKSFLREKEGKTFRDRLNSIKGLGQLKFGQSFKSGMCEGIQFEGKNKIRVFLKKENPDFLYSLDNAVHFVAPIEDFSEDLFNFKGIPRGTGNYVVQWSSPKRSLVRLKIRNV